METDERHTVPIEDISALMLESRRATLSAAALSALAQNGTAVFVCDEKHLPCGVLLPYAQHSRHLAAARAQLSLTLPAKQRFWQQLVTAKIGNQAECLALCGKTQEAACLHSRARAVTSGDKDNLEAVSYTHLDVYKRQPLYFAASAMPPAMETPWPSEPVWASTPGVWRISGCLLYTSRPRSHTAPPAAPPRKAQRPRAPFQWRRPCGHSRTGW